jgi:hypothetical protein
MLFHDAVKAILLSQFVLDGQKRVRGRVLHRGGGVGPSGRVGGHNQRILTPEV